MKQVKQISVVLVLIFIQILFGVNFPVSKIIVSKMDPILWSNLRFLIAGIGMLIITVLARRKHPRVDRQFLKGIIPLSLFGMGVGQSFFLVGLKYTTSINAAILITSIPILTLLIVVLRRQEELTGPKIIGFIFSFMGVVLMRDFTQISFGSSTLFGDFLVLLGALCFALYLSFGKSFFSKYDNMWATTWMFFISAAFMSLYNFTELINMQVDHLNASFYWGAAYSIFGATLLTYLLNNWALRKSGSGHVALFIYLQPVVAGVIGYFFLEEIISFRVLFCSFLVLIGLAVSIKKSH